MPIIKQNEIANVLVTGATGQLGHDIVEELAKRNIPTIGIGSADLDITDDEAVKKYFDLHKFSAVFHSASYTKVDLAETEKEKNFLINAHGTENIVSACKKQDIPIMYFSTDYVFGGEGEKPFIETDPLNPLGEYAKAKCQGEKYVMDYYKHFVLRISWVFGINGNNFIKTMLKLSETRKELNVVSDQIGSPTYTRDIAKIACDMIATDKYGVYHVTNEGFVSWADFARAIFKKSRRDIIIHDTTTEEYNAKAMRPKNSRLDKTKLEMEGFRKLPPWEDALDRYLVELGIN